MYMFNLQSEWPFLVDLWTVISRNIILFIIHRIVVCFVLLSFSFFCWRDNSLSLLRFFLTFRRKFSPTKSSANFTVSIDFSISVHGILFCLIYVLLSDSQVISVKQSYIPWIELTGLYIHWCEAFVPFPPACNQTFEVKLSNLSFKKCPVHSYV